MDDAGGRRRQPGCDAGPRRRTSPAPRSPSPAASPPGRRCGASRRHWPEHARHVAVEFVHPVIMGKRALPAVASSTRRSGRRAAGRVARPATCWSSSAAPTTGRCRRRCCGAPGVGADDASGSAPGPRPPAGRGRPRALGRRRRPAPPAHDGRLVLLLPPAVGAHPRLLRAPGPARAGRGRVRRCDGRASPAPTRDGSAEVVAGRRDGRASVRTARGAETVDTHARRRRSRPGDLVLVHAGTAIARRRRRPTVTLRAPTSCTRSSRATSATAGALLADLAASADGQGRRQRARSRSPRSTASASDARRRWPATMAERFARRRPAVHVRQRRQLDRRRVAGRAVRPPAVGTGAARPLPRRGHGRAHRARQRRRLRPRLLPAADRPRAAGRHRPRPVDERQLAQPARRLRRGAPPRAADGRSGRLRRRRDGRVAATSSTASSSRPTACTASRRPRPRWRFALWSAVQERAAGTMADAATAPATARPRSSTASTRSAAAGRASPTTS